MSEPNLPEIPPRDQGESFDPTVGRVSGKKLVLSVLAFVGVALIVYMILIPQLRK
jgi:hypothetical protein